MCLRVLLSCLFDLGRGEEVPSLTRAPVERRIVSGGQIPVTFERVFMSQWAAITSEISCKGMTVLSAYCHIPWSQRFFLIFLCERDEKQAAKRRQRVAKATRRERKTSGYLGLESHFHADDSCQTRQIANKKSDQWPFSKHVLISCYFFKRG